MQQDIWYHIPCMYSMYMSWLWTRTETEIFRKHENCSGGVLRTFFFYESPLIQAWISNFINYLLGMWLLINGVISVNPFYQIRPSLFISLSLALSFLFAPLSNMGLFLLPGHIYHLKEFQIPPTLFPVSLQISHVKISIWTIQFTF